MSDDKKFLDLTNEITALKEQHEANLADYSAKVSAFDKEIKALAVKKADLEKAIIELNNEKDSIENVIAGSVKKAEGIISAAKAEASQIVSKAEESVAVIISDADLREKKALSIESVANQRESQANLALGEANSHLFYAKDARLKAEEALANANRKAQDAIKASVEAESIIATANVKREATELAEKALNAVRKAVDEQQIEIASTKGMLSDQKVAFEKEKANFLAGIEEKRSSLEAKESEILTLREQLIKQKDANSFRTAELDAGFLKLKREQAELKKQQTIVDNMKKELSNQGD